MKSSFADLRAQKRADNRLRVIEGGKRQYAAAKTSRLTGDWVPAGQGINELLRSSASTVRARVRQLVRDFPYFARAANIMVDFTVGTGTVFQSRVLNPDWTPGAKKGVPKFDRVTCQKIEDAVKWGMDELDASGRMHGHAMERLAKREEVEAGEFLFVKTYLKDSKRFTPFALHAYEGEWIANTSTGLAEGNKVEQGVEYDPKTGRMQAIHLTDPSNYGSPQRIDAEYVLHGFDTTRAGQMRGISPFVTAVLVAHDLADYLDATIDTAKLAAKYLAMIETSDAAAFQSARSVAGEGADEGKQIEDLENAIIEYLRPGEKITFAKNDTPGQTFEPFTKFVLRTVAIATGVPVSVLTGNYSETNFTSLRGERQDVLKMFAPQQDRHVRQFVAPVSREIITSAVLSGKLVLPGYFKDQRRYWRGVWIPPGMEPIDPLRESKANRDDIEAGLRSPQEIAAKRGRDIEEVLDELAEFDEMAADRGLILGFGSTSLANNPAAVENSGRDLSRLIARAVEDAFDRRELLNENEETDYAKK